MVNKSRTIPAVLAVVALAAAPVGCAHRSANSQQATGNPAATEFAAALHSKVTTDAMMAHLSKLQDIANANNGTRAVGTSGYDASVDYVVNTLRGNGFDVQTPEFSARVFHAEKPVVSVAGRAVEARALEFSLGTGPDGVSGPLVSAPVVTARAARPPITTRCRCRAPWSWWTAVPARSRKRKTPRRSAAPWR